MKNKRKKEEVGKGIEELLKELRNKKGWSIIEVVQNLNAKDITEKDVKKWEIGLEYPDLDMVYKLSELYQIPSEELIQAKNNSYQKGMAGINANFIKWICYVLNVSFYTGMVLLIIIYIILLVGSLLFFTFILGTVDKTKI